MAYCSVEQVRAALRMTGTVIDAERIALATDAAAEAIDFYIDWAPETVPPDPVPRSLELANIDLAVEEYRRPGAAFGLLGFNDPAGTHAIPADHLTGVVSLLGPFKQRWGVA